jgi:hypothetical protein
VIEEYWGKFAKINHKLISGKGTFEEYNAAYDKYAADTDTYEVEAELMQQFVSKFGKVRKKLSTMLGEKLPDSFDKLGLF